MKDRIVLIRKDAGLSQGEMAEKLNLTRNYISLIECGNRVPSDRTISDICREFGINENWLRTGVGEMKSETTQRQKLTRFFADVLATAPDDRSAFVAALDDLPPEFWPLVVELAKGIVENIKKEED